MSWNERTAGLSGSEISAYLGLMDEESTSRPRVHPTQAARPPRAVGVPEQRGLAATESATGSAATVRRVMDLARIILAVIFAMLLLGLVISFILTRS
jgi:hypothetical protein